MKTKPGFKGDDESPQPKSFKDLRLARVTGGISTTEAPLE